MQGDVSQCQTQPWHKSPWVPGKLGEEGELALSNKGMQENENHRTSLRQADLNLHFSGGQGLGA